MKLSLQCLRRGGSSRVDRDSSSGLRRTGMYSFPIFPRCLQVCYAGHSHGFLDGRYMATRRGFCSISVRRGRGNSWLTGRKPLAPAKKPLPYTAASRIWSRYASFSSIERGSGDSTSTFRKRSWPWKWKEAMAAGISERDSQPTWQNTTPPQAWGSWCCALLRGT